MNRSLLESVVRRISASAESAISDADLLKRFAANRDEAAFAALVRRHGPLVWAVCRGLLPVEHDAEDAFQATFLALVRAAQSVRAPSSVGAWLHGAAYRVALKARRTAGRRRPRERAVARTEAAAPIADCTWDQLRAALHEEVNRLPEELRTAFVMCELEGIGQREAADALGWKIGTLSGRLTKARKRLLERLDRRGVSAGLAVTAAVAGGSATAGIPASWVAKVMTMARTSGDLNGIVSNSILELARGATEVTMMRTKLMAAAAILAVVVGGTAAALIPHAGAQEVPGKGAPPAPPATLPGVPAMGPGGLPLLPSGELPATLSSPAAPDAPPQAVPAMPGAAPAIPHTAPSVPTYPGTPGLAASPRVQWEYEFVPWPAGNSNHQFRAMLVQYGDEGWEYCGTEPASPRESGVTLVFKRVKSHGASGATTLPPTPSYPAPSRERRTGASANPGTTTPAIPSPYGAPAMPAPGTAPSGYPGSPSAGVPTPGGAPTAPGAVAPAPGGQPSGPGAALPKTPADGYSYYGKTPVKPAGPGMGPGATPKTPNKSASPTDNVPDKNATVVHLSHTLSDEVATAIGDYFAKHGGRIISDPRTNSVIIFGDDAEVALMHRLIDRLDKAPDAPIGTRGK